MGVAIGDILPLAAAIALFPIPILAVILFLFSPRAKGNVPAYLIGWIAGIAIVLTVAALLTSGVEEAADDESYHGVDWVRIVIGAVLLIFAAKKWLGRPKGPDVEMPGWMATIDQFTPAKSLGLGFALAAVNPKNLALVASAGTAVGQPDLSTAEAAFVALVFTKTATLGLLIPVAYYIIGGANARTRLDNAKSWLIENNAVVMTVLMLLIGVVLIGEGIRGF